MSPALFVMWWLLRWRWRPVLAACLWSVALSVMALAVVDLDFQIRFYTRVLPQFANGNYNGLRVPIDMFANHSIPNVYHQLWPGGAHRLTAVAQEASRITSAVLLLGLGGLFWLDTPDKRREWAQLSAVGVLLLLVPVFCYEHHVVWAIPAVVVIGMALLRRELPLWVWAPFLAAVFVWAMPLTWIKPSWVQWRADGLTIAALFVQEIKFVSLLVFACLSAFLGSSWSVSPGSSERRS